MTITAAVLIGAVVLTSPLPPERPVAVDEQPLTDLQATSIAPRTAPMPRLRPRQLAAQQPPVTSPVRSGGNGAFACKDPRIIGQPVPPILGRGSCGIASPVKITSIDGVKLSVPATINCRTARVFANWITSAARPMARQIFNSSLRSIQIYGTYSCRTRNHRPGARLSEHAFGRAVDIGAFTLQNGERITVLNGWGNGSQGRYLKQVWRKACGPFKTVLGPDADRAHRDHFHFDTALRRSSYCR